MIHIGVSLAHALAVCHEKSIVHRALSPKAVLLQAAPQAIGSLLPTVKLLGFSLVKLLHGDPAPAGRPLATLLGRRIGVGVYLAPEQAAGSSDVDGQADVFVLGMLLAELLLGRPLCPTHQPDAASTLYLVSDLFPVFAESTEPLKALLRTMTMRSPKARPTMKQVHEQLTLLYSAKHSAAAFPRVAVHELAPTQLPGQLRVTLTGKTSPADRRPAPTLSVRLAGAKGPITLTTHLGNVEDAIVAEQHEGARRRLLREGLLALPDDELNAIYHDTFSDLQQKFSSSPSRHEMINVILQHFSPDAAIREILNCLGVQRKVAG